jgi:hypothetical protein
VGKHLLRNVAGDAHNRAITRLRLGKFGNSVMT